MRKLRKSLISLLENARLQHHLDVPAPRLQAVILHHALRLLPHPSLPFGKKKTALVTQTLSHQALHRHIILIRCPDQAFYLDAIKGYLLRAHIQPIAQQTMVASMQCDDDACDIQIRHPDASSEHNFMFIALHLSATLLHDCQPIAHDLKALLHAVELSVSDFKSMSRHIQKLVEHLEKDASESAKLLQWMNEDRYLLFGMQYLNNTNANQRLGLMRNKVTLEHVVPHLHQDIMQLEAPKKLGLAWLHLKSSQNHLYSSTSIEVLRITWNASASINKKEWQSAIIIGHFSRSARHANASQIPCISQQWHDLCSDPLLQQSAFYRREIRTLFDRMPKPILASIPSHAWLAPLRETVDLTLPTHIVLKRLSPEYGNSEYLFLAMHSRRFGPNVMTHIQASIQALGLQLSGHDSFGVGPYRIIMIALHALDAWPNMSTLHSHIQSCIIFWKDHARRAILQHATQLDVPTALNELEQLPALYQDLFSPEQFLKHYQVHEKMLRNQRIVTQAFISLDIIDIHVFSKLPILLGDLIDKIQAFGLLAMHEAAVDFGHHDDAIHIYSIHCQRPETFHAEALPRLSLALEYVLNDEADHDPINALLISAGLDHRQIATLITLRNHLIQLLPNAAPTPLSQMLNNHPQSSAALYHVFEAKHRPAMPNTYLEHAKAQFEESMNHIENLTDDRWFRSLFLLVLSSLRTNAYVRQINEPLAIKIDPHLLDFAPRPLPYREIIVHGGHVEGIHLRGGAISRGGIRYSDRPADFRTEVLELMSTQIVKNGQIVPTGAKGGFVIRGQQTPSPAFVLTQYKQFIAALLGLTDNLIHDECIPPDGIYVPDDDCNDPYLVVAADKGTARFSDDANDEARFACFWLDDGFASGGKHGYDHKVFGITARGAWACAAYHFNSLGKDAYQDAMSCIGIGDMGGDVFGNGMLINPHLLLLGAFNHQHIFLDPQPNIDRAYGERQRLFEQVKGWGDYDTSLISDGGGIFQRSSKRIQLSEGVCNMLGIEDTYLSGEALIQAMLQAPVDLLYNGGIGTYVKASHESHTEVQDPANNAVRIDANQLRCQVVCEGGNLGFTQQARIEYAEQGGYIYTDAIDNAAGVNMSDREVNLKIIFTSTQASSLPLKQRNRLLSSIGDTVAKHCLDDNRMQAEALVLAQQDAFEHPPRLLRLRDTLLKEGRLDRRVDPALNEISQLSLLPQLAVILGHEKNRIHQALDDEGFETWSHFTDLTFEQYFPTPILRKFKKEIHQHPLKADIAHTQVTNHIVNQMGLFHIHHLQTLLDAPIAHICETLMITETFMDIAILKQTLTTSILDSETLHSMQRGIQEYIMHFAEEWLRLTDVRQINSATLRQQHQGMRRFRQSLQVRGIGGNESSRYLSMLKSAIQSGLAMDMASHLAALPELTQMAIGCHLSQQLSLPLNRCLHATQAVLHILPFSALEIPMRSSEWGSENAHPLRREWLNRLTMLKKRATEKLLLNHTNHFIKHGEALWSSHKHWSYLQQFNMQAAQQGEGKGGSDEQRRMQLMLAMTRLEALIENSESC